MKRKHWFLVVCWGWIGIYCQNQGAVFKRRKRAAPLLSCLSWSESGCNGEAVVRCDLKSYPLQLLHVTYGSIHCLILFLRERPNECLEWFSQRYLLPLTGERYTAVSWSFTFGWLLLFLKHYNLTVPPRFMNLKWNAKICFSGLLITYNDSPR